MIRDIAYNTYKMMMLILLKNALKITFVVNKLMEITPLMKQALNANKPNQKIKHFPMKIAE